jgi:hypothetical protein
VGQRASMNSGIKVLSEAMATSLPVPRTGQTHYQVPVIHTMESRTGQPAVESPDEFEQLFIITYITV